ncbi:MAG: VCBS repeat-containing protein, partial [Bacteroidota bacterium]
MGQDSGVPDFSYIAIDSNKQKWGDWQPPDWLRYFGLDAGDLDRDGNLDILSGRYIYHNPGGDMSGAWRRSVLDDNVDGLFILDVDGDAYADLIAMALPDVFWYEAINAEGTRYRRKRIATVPATTHINSQGFEKADIIAGGKPEMLIAGNGNVYMIEIPADVDLVDEWPTHLIGQNTSDEGIGVGDIDGDGDLDIACGRRPEGESEPSILIWFENPGSVNELWQDRVIGSTDHPIDRVAIADLDGNQQADIIITEERYPGKEPDANVWFFSQTAQQQWHKNHLVTQYSTNNLDVADIDHDGDLDILTAEHKGDKRALQLWQNDGSARFNLHILDTGPENHLGAQWLDLDQDGDLDIIGAAWDNYRWMHVWRNQELEPLRSGDVFRDYSWRPGKGMKEDFLRVGGQYHYADYPDFFPKKLHQDGNIRLTDALDLDQAIRAELLVERLQSHEGTTGLQIQLNEENWLPLHPPASLPDSAENYLFHHQARVAVPLDMLSGKDVTFRLKVDEQHPWNWPQNIIYAVSLRIFYGKEKTDINGQLAGIQSGEEIQASQKLEFQSPHLAAIQAVDVMGLYEEINWQGDGIYRQWQYAAHQADWQHHIGRMEADSVHLIWDTHELADQFHPISLMGRIMTKDGLSIMTRSIDNLSLSHREQHIRILKPYHQPAFWVTRSGEFAEQFLLEDSLTQVANAYWRSWSPCYQNGIDLNGTSILVPDTTGLPCYEYFEYNLPLSPQALKQGSNLLRTLQTPLIEGEMVHGMEVQWPGIMVRIKSMNQPSTPLTSYECQYEGTAHIVVKTAAATYYYDKVGGGFSRIIDEDGNDWIGFKRTPWGNYPASAASSFRGLPNLVYQGVDDGAGHPGHQKCRSYLDGNTIVSESLSGKWRWRWTFGDQDARLDVEKADPERAYWFLYEGTPGGRYAPEQSYFGTNQDGPLKQEYNFYKGDILKGQFDWMYAGTQTTNRCFYMLHLSPDEYPGIISYLGNQKESHASTDGMTVWGFGRDTETQPHLRAKQAFVIGLYPSSIDSPE